MVLSHHRAKEQNFFYGLIELVTLYEKSKQALYREDSELSFNDVTVLVHYLLKERIDSEFLYFRLDATIEHILLDEFQDTSILQYEILKPLIEEIISGEGIFSEGSFFFVGDVKQSIYRFRGGVSALFEVVKEESQTDVAQLLTNYRSQKEVIEFVNRIFTQKIKNYSAQMVREEADGGYVEIIETQTLLEETLTQVKRVIALGGELDTIAILCATNGDGEAIKEALEKEGIAVVTETTTKLINQKIIKAILEYLKYLYFNEDIYKYNFFALINQEVRDKKRVDFNMLKLLDIIKKAIDEYALFSGDFHLIRFLDIVSNYSDIESLLFEYERIDASAALSDLSGVRVLTIHKSKGLEYEDVIVMDRLKNAPPARDTIIYEYDQITLKNLYLRTKGREALDVAYANALAKERSLVKEDTLNALYVAFTRAKENLFIIQKPKSSSFASLELQRANYGVLRSKKKLTPPQKEHCKTFEYKSLYYGTQSNILALQSEKDEDLKAINFGLSLHYMLEMMGEFTQESIADAKDMMINKYGFILQESEIDDIQKRVTMLIQNSTFLNIINGECYKEKAIRYRDNLYYIDLLIKAEDGSWCVVDYKSSKNYEDKHYAQVLTYINAIRIITGDEVNGYICYILQDSIELKKIDI